MTCGRQRRCPELPVDIWQQIARHMDYTSEWVQVSRTCRAMSAVQPQLICVKVRCESAMSWLQSHWGQARRLELSVASNVSWATSHKARSLITVNLLDLTGWTDDKNPTIGVLLAQLQTLAPNLRLLHIAGPEQLAVPSFKNLVHLIMSSIMFSAEAVASIRELSNLHTLWLGKYGYGERHYMKKALPCAELDLSGLVHLYCVTLQYVVVPDFSLPSQCRVHLIGNAASVLDVDVWMKAASQGLLQSIHIDRDGFDGFDDIDEIPDLLTQSRCRSLNWQGLQFLGSPGGLVIFDRACFLVLVNLHSFARIIAAAGDTCYCTSFAHFFRRSHGLCAGRD